MSGAKTRLRGERTVYCLVTEGKKGMQGKETVGVLPLLLEAAGEGTKMADHLSPIVRPAFPSSAIISERSSPSRVRFAAPNNGAPLTAPGRSEQRF